MVEDSNKLKEEIKILEEEKQKLNELFAVESGSPIEQALRRKGKSIINMVEFFTDNQLFDNSNPILIINYYQL